ncbi:MAG TPA: helix-turn-helix domain-containing protein [Solirubrobacteraceae bacterium]|jgi:transposase
MSTYYSQEFKDQIVEQYRQGRTAGELGREFNLSPTSVANWVRASKREGTAEMKKAKPAQATKGPPETPEAKIARLERELAQKDQDLKILGKALAFFVRRTDR